MISYVLQKIIFCSTGHNSLSELSDAEITAVKEVWARARNEDIGMKILSELIDKKPTFAVYYGFEPSLAGDELRRSQLFILQAKRIQDFLDTAVSSLGLSPDKTIHNMSYRVGQIHYYKGVNFGADNWLVFKRVTIEQVIAAQKKSSFITTLPYKDLLSKEVKENNDVIQSGNQKRCLAIVGWNKLMGMVIREMKRDELCQQWHEIISPHGLRDITSSEAVAERFPAKHCIGLDAVFSKRLDTTVKTVDRTHSSTVNDYCSAVCRELSTVEKCI